MHRSPGNWLERTELLLGHEKLIKLKNCHVLIVGLGGVGAYAAEQICRAGVGEMTIVDGDNIHLTNINRQLPALSSSIGMPKADFMGQRLLDINPILSCILSRSISAMSG
jgi:tRNA A37 threonylcarbamoyladenosine dehydratase